MSVVTNYSGTLSAPAGELGYFMLPETKVKVGSARLWATGGLETTSYLYTTYTASVNLQTGEGFELGLLNALNFTYEPDRQPVETVSIADAPAYELVGEDCTVSIELFEWNPEIIALVIGSGQYHKVSDNDHLIRFGGGCGATYRPIVIEGTNISCNVSTITDLTDGLLAFVITLYDAVCTSGLNADFTAQENSTISTEWEVLPATELDAGNRLGNIYMYAG